MRRLAALLTVLTLGSTALASEEELLLGVGEPAPPFSMRDLGRKVFSLSKHVGDGAEQPRKAIVAVFFATWCKPCMKEIPII